MTTTQIVPWKRISVEALAIVASILLAFAIEAWWDDRQESRQAEQMVAALQIDFADSKESLTLGIERIEARLADTKRLMSLHSEGQLPVKEMRRYFQSALTAFLFRPSLSSYESGVATGNLNTLESRALNRAFSEFFFALQTYSQVLDMSAENFFVGPVWDVRRSIGELEVLYREPDELPARFRLSEAEYRELVARADVYALVGNLLDIHANMLSSLRNMEDAASAILAELETL